MLLHCLLNYLVLSYPCFVVGTECEQEDLENMEPSGSCSSPEENAYDGEEWLLELDDDFCILDGEVGKRLNQMVPKPVSF